MTAPSSTSDPAPTSAPARTVGASLVIECTAPTSLLLAVAATSPRRIRDESLTLTLDGAPVDPIPLDDPHGGRLHEVPCDEGTLRVEYRAVVGEDEPEAVDPTDAWTYLRPSRYCESDTLRPVAQAEFAGLDGHQLLSAVSSWVGTRLSYVPGSSGPTDGAVRTLLNRQGVCRDYAHLTTALFRALDVPARLAAVYAPGLDPMDFHAVTEAAIDGRWCVVDATTLAPRSTLVRIATGRDAADTAFLTQRGGVIELRELEVTATAERLPDDDLDRLVSIT